MLKPSYFIFLTFILPKKLAGKTACTNFTGNCSWQIRYFHFHFPDFAIMFHEILNENASVPEGSVNFIELLMSFSIEYSSQMQLSYVSHGFFSWLVLQTKRQQLWRNNMYTLKDFLVHPSCLPQSVWLEIWAMSYKTQSAHKG